MRRALATLSAARLRPLCEVPALYEASSRVQRSFNSTMALDDRRGFASLPMPFEDDGVDDYDARRRAELDATSSGRRLGVAERREVDDVLIDSFGRRHTYLRISLTERCNLRCQYCMPAEGVDLTPNSQLMSTEEVLRVARLFVSAGVDKIRLTGGEPTVRSDLEDIAAGISALPGLKHLGITSNGIVLGKKLPGLLRAGVDKLNISLDTLLAPKFELLTRRRGLERVLDSIDTAIALGYDPVKVNCVVMRGVNDDELVDFVAMTRDKPINVRFIEYMPFDGNKWATKKLVPYAEMRARIEDAYPGMTRADDAPEEVAKNFNIPGHRGSVSFVTSMTSHFCGGCNRLRIMADGNLKVCLFGSNEVSLRDAMRSGAPDNDLRELIGAAVKRKKAAHAGIAASDLAGHKNRAMIKIGG